MKKKTDPCHDPAQHTSASQHTKQPGRSRKATALPSSLPEPPEALLDLDGLCQFLHLGKTKIWELIHQEGLPVHTFGSAYRFDRTEVWVWLQKRRQIQ